MGKDLLPVTDDIVAQWRQRKKAQEDQEAKNRAAALIEQKIIADTNRTKDEAANECDRLAANPYDLNKSTAVSGVSYGVLGAQAAQAIAACEKAIPLNPDELRLKYQLARAYQPANPAKATQVLEGLIAQNYPAAFDNLAALYQDGRAGRTDLTRAGGLLLRGVDLGDPDSMMSYAKWLINTGGKTSSSPEVYALYQKAALAGHPDAITEVNRIDREQATNKQVQDLFLRGLGGLFDKIGPAKQ